MKVKLIRPLFYDGMEFGPGSILDLDPAYSQSLISAGKAESAERKKIEISEPLGPTEKTAVKRKKEEFK